MTNAEPGRTLQGYLFPLSSAQKRLWVLTQMRPRDFAYNVSQGLHIEGPLDRAALEQSLREIIKRHEILRTSFVLVGDEPMQLIQTDVEWALDFERAAEDEGRSERARVFEQMRREAAKPFDLTQGPLLRAILYRLGADEHVLFLNLHHIVCDGWSLGILVQEMSALYPRFCGREDLTRAVLPELEFQYADYSEWHREWVRSAAVAPHLAYWKERLGGSLPRLDLPTDRLRPSITTHAGHMIRKSLDRATVSKLRRFSQQSGATLFMTMLAAFLALLHRYSGSEDIVVGTPVANRPHATFENTIGLFVNSLALRTRLSGDWTFAELLAQVRADCLDAYTHQDLPFEMLIEQLQPERSSAFSPVFQQMFALQNATLGNIDWPGLRVKTLRVHNGSSKLDLTLIAEETEEELLLTLEYATDLFLEETATRMLEHYCHLLSTVVSQPQQRICDISLLDALEPKPTRQQRPDTYTKDAGTDLVTWFERAARRHPDRLALSHGHTQLTYTQLNARANRLARLLRSRGLAPESLLALCLDRSSDILVCLLAALKAGAAYLPLDPAYPQHRLCFLLSDAAPTLLIADRRSASVLPVSTVPTLLLDELGDELDTFPAENLSLPIDPAQAAYVIYTSGSTGTPKGCVVTHANVCGLMSGTAADFAFSASDVWTLFHSYAFDFSVWELWGALLHGGRLVVVPYLTSREPERFYELLRDEGVTVLNQTPSAFRQLLAHEESRGGKADELSLRYVIFGGEALDPSCLRGWIERHGDEHPQLVNMYGITETTVHVTRRRIVAEDVARAVGSPIGEALAGVRAYVLDGRMREAPDGVRGELYVGGSGVARGYLNRSALTAERFVPDALSGEWGARLYRSGDVARRRGGGGLEYVGRGDTQVKVRGFRIELAEIEAALIQQPAVREAVVVARDEADGEKRLAAYVVLNEQQAHVGEALRDFLGERLPEYMLPSVFVFLPALPLTEHGKVDRRALPEPSFERPELSAGYVAARTALEQALVGIWSEVLKVKNVGIEDNFFGLGGDSILALQVAAKAGQRKLSIRPEDILQRQTIKELAEVAERTLQTQVTTVEGSEVPLTPIQSWFFELHVPHRSHWNQSVAVELKREIAERDLSEALQAVAHIHDAFALRFRQEHGRWSQRYADDGRRLPLSVIDLSGLDASEREAARLSHIKQLQASLDIENGPPARAVYFSSGPSEPPVLALAVHHLIVDGVSWRILLEDLAQALSQRLEQKPLALDAPAESFGGWARRLQEAAAQPELLSGADYWLREGDEGGTDAAAWPCDYQAGPDENTEGSRCVVSSLVPLPEASSANGARPSGRDLVRLLLASVARLHAEVTGHPDLLIAMEDHGRRDLGRTSDVSRTVGWFTAIYPLLLRGCGEADPGLWLDSLEQQLEELPRHGMGYGLLRYASHDAALRERLAASPSPQMSFNYLGQLWAGQASGEMFRLRRDLMVDTHAPDARRPFSIDLVAFVDGESLQIDWLFSERLHKRSTVERWAALLVEQLRRFIRQPRADERRPRPSNFPLADLSHRALDRLVEAAHGNVQDVYPLSPMQEGMLFHTIGQEGERFYFEQLTASLTGRLNADAFREAWQDVIDRHEVLRAGFFWEGLEKPLQVVRRRVRIPFREEDWRDLEQPEQARRFDSLLGSDLTEEFALSESPLLRITLVRTSQDSWRLLWSYHHILLDGWSLPVLLLELLECYRARIDARPAKLAPPPAFRDYIAWLLRQDTTRAEVYWHGLLRDYTPARIEGRSASMREGEQGCDEQQLTLAEDFYDALQRFAQAHHLTLNSIVQSAWALVLHRYGCGDDVVFGSTVSGRTAELPNVERAVGLFINTLPVRVRIARGQRLLDWLKQIQAQTFETHSYAFCRLVDIHRWSGVPVQQALFESLVVFENYPVVDVSRQQHEALHFTDISMLERTNYPLTLAAIPGRTLTLKLNFHRRRFGRATASGMLAEVRRILAEIVSGPSDSVGALLRRVGVERGPSFDDDDDGDASFASSKPVHTLFERQASLRPEAVALSAGAARLSYAELNARANQLAARLRRAGVGPESIVGLMLSRSFEFVASVLAILKAGAAYLPLDPLYPQHRLHFMLRDSGALLLVTSSEFEPLVADVTCPRILLDAEAASLAAEGTSNPDVSMSAANLAYVIYTSGSTGRPKGVAVSHQGLERLTSGQREFFALDAESRVYQFASTSFDASVSEIFVTLAGGATLCLPAASRDADRQDLPRALADSQATHVTLPPSLLAALSPSALPSLKVLVVAGEAGGADIFRKWSQGRLVVNAYGPTEATVCASMKTMTAQVDEPPTLGQVMRGSSLHLLSDELEVVPVGVTGEIYLGGEGLARGYLHQPGLTAAAFIPNPFASRPGERLYRTGDLGVRLENGEVQFVGRRDQQIKLRGYRIELAEIEAVLSAHPSVEAAVVVVRETAAMGSQLAAYVIGRRGQDISVEDLRQYASERLPTYEVPAVFVPMDSFPLTPNKKIDRAALASATQKSAAPQTARGPLNETEKILSEIWAEVLRVPEVGAGDNFFELGGDSIISLQIASRAREASLALTPRDIMTHQTIERLALVARADVRPRVGPDSGDARFELTPIQSWFMTHDWPAAHQWNQSITVEATRPPALAPLREALRAVFERHDALRLRFVETGEGWREFYEPNAAPPEPERLDLSTLSPEDATAEFRRVANTAQAGFNLADGPLFCAVYGHMPEGCPDRLLLAAHHLIVDAVSWSIIVEELLTAYRQRLDERPISLPLQSASFKTWAERLKAAAASAEWHAEAAFWLDVSSTPASPFPTDFASADDLNVVAHRQVVTASLSEPETSALLKETRAAYYTSVPELLLTAVAQAVAEHTGSRTLLFDVEGHGREPLWDDVDVSRTVGWFTSLHPVRITLPASADDPRSCIVAVKEQVRAVPRQGIGYGVLRYLSNDETLRAALSAAAVPHVGFNYLGTLGESAALPEGFRVGAGEASGEQSPSQTLPHLLEINAAVREGRLALDFSCSARIFRRATVQGLADECLKKLRLLIEHCRSPNEGAYTPSDFTGIELSAEDLTAILDDVAG